MTDYRFPIIPHEIYPDDTTILSKEWFTAVFNSINQGARSAYNIIVPDKMSYTLTSSSVANTFNLEFIPINIVFPQNIGNLTSISVIYVPLFSLDEDELTQVTLTWNSFGSTASATVDGTPTVFGVSPIDVCNTPENMTMLIPTVTLTSPGDPLPVTDMLGYFVLTFTFGSSSVRYIVQVVPSNESLSSTYINGSIVLLNEPTIGSDITAKAVIAWPHAINTSERYFMWQYDGGAIGSPTLSNTYTIPSITSGSHTINCYLCDHLGSEYYTALNPYTLVFDVVNASIASGTVDFLPNPMIVCSNPIRFIDDTNTYAIKIDLNTLSWNSTDIFELEFILNNATDHIGTPGTDVAISSTITNVRKHDPTGPYGSIGILWESTSDSFTIGSVDTSLSTLPIIYISIDTSLIPQLKYGFTDGADAGSYFDWSIKIRKEGDPTDSVLQVINITHIMTCSGSEPLGMSISTDPTPISIVTEPIVGKFKIDIDGLSQYISPGIGPCSFKLAVKNVSGNDLLIGSDVILPVETSVGDTSVTLSSGSTFTFPRTFTVSDLLVGNIILPFKVSVAGTRSLIFYLYAVDCLVGGVVSSPILSIPYNMYVGNIFTSIPHPVVNGHLIVDMIVNSGSSLSFTLLSHITSLDNPLVNDTARECSFILGTIPALTFIDFQYPSSDFKTRVKNISIQHGAETYYPTDYRIVAEPSSNLHSMVTDIHTGTAKICKISPVVAGVYTETDVIIYFDTTQPEYLLITQPDYYSGNGIVVARINYSQSTLAEGGSLAGTNPDSIDPHNDVDAFINPNSVWNKPTEVITPNGLELIRGAIGKNPIANQTMILTPHEINASPEVISPLIVATQVPIIKNASNHIIKFWAVGAWKEYKTGGIMVPSSMGIITSSGPVTSAADCSRISMNTPYGNYVMHENDGGRVQPVPDIMASFYLLATSFSATNLTTNDTHPDLTTITIGTSAYTRSINIATDTTVGSKVWNFVSKAAVIIQPIATPITGYTTTSAKIICKGYFDPTTKNINIDAYVIDGSNYHLLPVRVFVIGSTSQQLPSFGTGPNPWYSGGGITATFGPGDIDPGGEES